MENLWKESEAAKCQSDLDLRVYTSRLLGASSNLVLHGGGNTSVKVTQKNLFGEDQQVLLVKGSGWDLSTIQAPGFSPVDLETLKKLGSLESLSDTDMMRELKAAQLDPNAPAPSVEAILHAVIPYKFVDHTHADSVVTLSNTPHGDKLIEEIYGKDVLIFPYTMPGFILSKQIHQGTLDVDWSKYKGIILLHHGVFTFSDDPKVAYDNMIELVTRAEDYLKEKKLWNQFEEGSAEEVPATIVAKQRKLASEAFGAPLLLRLKRDGKSVGYSNLANIAQAGKRGPITPDHVIQTKRIPMMIGGNFALDLQDYAKEYQKYFDSHKQGELTCLDKVPRYAIWPGKGVLCLGPNLKRLQIVSDIVDHTMECVQYGEKLGGWTALPAQDVFDLEYWELEQAKLKRLAKASPYEGKVAVVTGAASGIGKAVVNELVAAGICVAALDINPELPDMFKSSAVLTLTCDVTSTDEIKRALSEVVFNFGGIDMLVTNAGSFPPSQKIEELADELWEKTLHLNLTSHLKVMRECVPYLKQGIDPAVVVMGSKNVPAPGPGAAAYSASKAGLTQLARVAALELGSEGIRVNSVHPNAVFDTGIWTEEVLQKRAKSYGLTVDEYKRNNVLKAEVSSKNVAELVLSLLGPTFSRTTGAQIPVDGGNERVI